MVVAIQERARAIGARQRPGKANRISHEIEQAPPAARVSITSILGEKENSTALTLDLNFKQRVQISINTDTILILQQHREYAKFKWIKDRRGLCRRRGWQPRREVPVAELLLVDEFEVVAVPLVEVKRVAQRIVPEIGGLALPVVGPAHAGDDRPALLLDLRDLVRLRPDPLGRRPDQRRRVVAADLEISGGGGAEAAREAVG